jgi:toxin HigB-1
MIRSFKHKGLKPFYEVGDRSKLPDVATTVRDMDLPQFRLHLLTGNRKGQWAVTVRANRRIVFRFDSGEAEDVDFTDYR